MPAEARPEHLFSYGTLQLESVQMGTFGRPLKGSPDALVGFELRMLEIDDPKVVELSGKPRHPIVAHTGNPGQEVAGVVFEVTMDEVLKADTYEVAAYRRVPTTLRSGVRSWVYVDARFAPPGS
ncbi:MAG TPA: gamma-glutamylcyclotransferase family protein [Opitutaceae bacterium]|jgi:hypothetical protein